MAKGFLPGQLCLATLYMTTGQQEAVAELIPRSRSQLHYVQLELLHLKKWWREPAMCALIAGYTHLLQGNMEDAEILYAEARGGGLEVPPELFELPPHFDAILEEWAATTPLMADFAVAYAECVACSNSSSSPSALPPTMEHGSETIAAVLHSGTARRLAIPARPRPDCTRAS